MSTIDAALLGGTIVLYNGNAVNLPYKKAYALLYYIIIKRKVSRSELTALLWPDVETPTALKNLRHAIFTIRKSLGEDPFLQGQRADLVLDPAITVRCDATDFLEKNDISLYQGDFLSGFSVQREEEFNQWVNRFRETLRGKYLQLARAEGERVYSCHELEKAEQICLNCLDMDPFDENVVCLLMKIYCAEKKYRKAINQYDSLCKRLSSEFSISPLKETTGLYYEIVDEWNTFTYNESNAAAESDGELILGKDAAITRILALSSPSKQARHKSNLLIQGKAGVGKTHLLDYALKRFDFSDFIICRTFCYQSESTTPFSPWNMLMLDLMNEANERGIHIPDRYRHTASSLFSCLAVSSNEALTESPDIYPVPANYQAALEGTIFIFTYISKCTPLLLIFEDTHWMDENSAVLLSMLMRRVRNTKLRIICTCRESCPPYILSLYQDARRDGLLSDCVLEDLNEEETRLFIRSSYGCCLSDEQEQELYERTRGNPLLLVQALNSLQEVGTIALTRPASDIIETRLSRLSGEEMEVLFSASVFTHFVPVDALIVLTAQGALELLSLCEQLRTKNLLAETNQNGTLGYEFAHESIRAAVLERQTEAMLRIRYLRAAHYYEAVSDKKSLGLYEQLTYYFSKGGDRYQTLKYKILHLDISAGFCYEVLPTLTEAADEIAESRPKVDDYFGELDKELSVLRKLHYSEDTPELDSLEMTLLYTEVRFYIQDGAYRKAMPLLEKLLAQSQAAGDWKMSIKAHKQYVYYGIQTYNTDAMREHLVYGEKYKEQIAGSAEWGSYLRMLGLLALMHGRYEEARESMLRSVDTFRSLDAGDNGSKYALSIAGAYNYIAESYRLQGRVKEALKYYDEAIVYNRRRGYYPGAAVLYTNYGVAAFQMGNEDAAEKMFEYADEIYQAFDEFSEYPIALAYLAYFDAKKQEMSSARQRIRKALALCDRFLSPWWKGVTIYMMWKIRADFGDRQDIGELADLWPGSEEEHCEWCLSYLHQIEWREETQQIEQALQKLQQGAPA